jgi:transcriptional regulator with XRE-family HTH domain
MEIGTIIRDARNEAKLSQEKAAEALGVSRQTISNWENGKSYPDIISVIRMSDLYSVSLDHLLKEESSVKQTYKEYLEQSTNVVKSNEKKSKLVLSLVTLGIWALSLIAFILVHKGIDDNGYGLAVTWAVLPVTFFVASYIIGTRTWYGKLKWLAVPLFSILYTMAGYATVITAGNLSVKTVIWPDFAKLPIGLLISAAGLITGLLVRNRQNRAEQSQADSGT